LIRVDDAVHGGITLDHRAVGGYEGSIWLNGKIAGAYVYLLAVIDTDEKTAALNGHVGGNAGGLDIPFREGRGY
jgi:hypothetical protein